MALLDTLTDEIEARILLSTGGLPASSTLAGSVADTGAVSVTVEDEAVLSRGLLQVDDELMVVTSFNGTVGQVPAWGRGFGTSTAAAHSAGARVTVDSPYPRATIRTAIVASVDDLYPDLFGLGKALIPATPGTTVYALPAASRDVLSVKVQERSGDAWQPLKSWAFNKTAPLGDFPTGRTITVPPLLSLSKIDVLVEVAPSITATTASWTEMGLFPSAADCVQNATLYRLLSTVDAGMAGAQSASSAYVLRNSEKRVSAADLARQFYALYRESLERERARMLREYDTTINFQG